MFHNTTMGMDLEFRNKMLSSLLMEFVPDNFNLLKQRMDCGLTESN